jgi:hypothetical protein
MPHPRESCVGIKQPQPSSLREAVVLGGEIDAIIGVAPKDVNALTARDFVKLRQDKGSQDLLVGVSVFNPKWFPASNVRSSSAFAGISEIEWIGLARRVDVLV